jgi:hypothetical protein
MGDHGRSPLGHEQLDLEPLHQCSIDGPGGAVTAEPQYRSEAGSGTFEPVDQRVSAGGTTNGGRFEQRENERCYVVTAAPTTM